MTKGNGEVRELPKGWCAVPISQVCLVMSGQTPKGIDSKISSSGEIPWFRVGNMNEPGNEKFLRNSGIRLSIEEASSLGVHVRSAGTIIFPKRGGAIATNKKRILAQPSAYDLNLMGILPIGFNNQYFWYWFQTLDLKKFSDGSNVPQINHGDIEPLLIPIAPMFEQNRIVEKIEELFSELDQGIENLKTAQKQLKVYRQAVLRWAFEGKLTEQWRQQAQQQGTLKTGEELLAQIKAERENRYQQQVAEWEAAVKTWEANGKPGKKPSKPSKPKDLSPLTPSELAELPQLPNDWCWIRFGELVTSIRGGTTAVPVDYQTDYPILRSSSVRTGSIDYSDVRFLKPEQPKDTKDFVAVSDLLFTRLNGTVEYVGNCALVTESYPCNLIYPDRLYCAKLLLANLAKYAEKVFANPISRKIIESKAKSTAGHKRISISDVLEMPFPLAEFDEMDVIVLELESKLSIVENFDEVINENLQKAEALRQSILKQAFEGNLVPQDPNDEPAEKLLERIRAEKAKRQPPGKQLTIKMSRSKEDANDLED